MALKKPLAMYNGRTKQLQAGDTLDAPLNTPTVYAFTNAEAAPVTQGMAVYLFSAGNTKKARADATGTATALALVYDSSVGAGVSGTFMTDGVLAMSDWTTIIGSTNLSAGTEYFLSPTTAGLLTATAPTTVGQSVIYIGEAISTTELLVNIERPILL